MFSNLKELGEYHELLRTLVSKDIRARYKGSVLGFLWNFAIPLLQLLVFWILFGIIVRVQLDSDYPFAIFLFTGLLPWNFLANSLMVGSLCIVSNANLVKKIYFPLQILPTTVVISQLISLLLGMVVLALIVLVFGVGFSTYLLLLPLPLVVEFVFLLGLTYALSCANVFFRDVEHIIGIVVMAWMYVTPILYPISYLDDKPAWAQAAIHLNPMTGVITAFQDIILDHRPPDWKWLGYAALAALVTYFVGSYIFNRYKFRFEEEV